MQAKGILLYLLMVLSSIQGIEKPAIYVAPVPPTPESNQVYLHLAFPKEGEVVPSMPISAQLRVEGYPLGTYSQFDRADKILNDENGQSIRVIIDNLPYFSLYVSKEDSFDENRNFLDKIVSFHIPENGVKMQLSEGKHTIRAFPVRSFNESIKLNSAFIGSFFYLESSRSKDPKIDFSKPFITYNVPQGTYPRKYSNPILLDFLVHNCKLAKDGYKIRLTIDKNFRAYLIYPAPYYIYGLSPGKHTILLELLDEEHKIVKDINGLFNITERTIEIL